MAVFAEYANLYNVLYQDKDYLTEAKFIEKIITKHSKIPGKSVLELGCGTAKHAVEFAKSGYTVHGVDQSNLMLESAGSLLNNLDSDVADRIKLTAGDIRTFRSNEKYDIALSLFHVLSYQTTNADLESTFTTVAEQVKPGGLFIFDCWYGPAVLTDLPKITYKKMSNDKVELERVAVPEIFTEQNLVTVNYQMFYKNVHEKLYSKITETHHMRYLFKPEIENLAKQFNMQVAADYHWLQDKPISKDSFGACFVLELLS